MIKEKHFNLNQESKITKVSFTNQEIVESAFDDSIIKGKNTVKKLEQTLSIDNSSDILGALITTYKELSFAYMNRFHEQKNEQDIKSAILYLGKILSFYNPVNYKNLKQQNLEKIKKALDVRLTILEDSIYLSDHTFYLKEYRDLKRIIKRMALHTRRYSEKEYIIFLQMVKGTYSELLHEDKKAYLAYFEAYLLIKKMYKDYPKDEIKYNMMKLLERLMILSKKLKNDKKYQKFKKIRSTLGG